MKRRQTFLAVIAILPMALAAGCTSKDQSSPNSQTAPRGDSLDHEDPNGYWTCSMHPQVHEHEPGKCPICGMALIKVQGNQNQQKVEKKSEGMSVADDQLKNSQIGKYTVTKKDLEIVVPASGRLLNSREVVFQIYESEIAMIKVGQEFKGSPAGLPGRQFKGRITQIDTLIDPSSRTIRVVGLLNETISSQTTDRGFFGEIMNNLKNQVVIPEESVLFTGTRNLVYVFSPENKLAAREVEVGFKGREGYQILSGLSEAEIISANSNFLIDSEAKIRGQ